MTEAVNKYEVLNPDGKVVFMTTTKSCLPSKTTLKQILGAGGTLCKDGKRLGSRAALQEPLD